MNNKSKSSAELRKQKTRRKEKLPVNQDQAVAVLSQPLTIGQEIEIQLREALSGVPGDVSVHIERIKQDLESSTRAIIEEARNRQRELEVEKRSAVKRQTVVKLKTHLEASNSAFVGVDLSGQDLSGLDLSGLNFDGANLAGCNLQKCKLIGASFRGANLRGVNFTSANMMHADMSDADLTGAVVQAVQVHHVKLNGAIVEGTQLKLDMEEEWSRAERARRPTSHSH